MVMLDNKLYLLGVVEFLRRSSVDHGTREGKVVVGTDLSKRKVCSAWQKKPNFAEQIAKQTASRTK